VGKAGGKEGGSRAIYNGEDTAREAPRFRS
jgi:hypothetical protein